MKEIVRMIGGSHLYGSNVETSDLDLKGVYIPEGQDILLQQVRDAVVSHSPGEDCEIFSVQKFLNMVMQGQVVALDMLFTPERLYTQPPEPEWRCIQINQERFLSRGIQAFVGYCRQQARRYSVKIERYQAVRSLCDFLRRASIDNPSGTLAGTFRVEDVPGLQAFVDQADDYTFIEDITLANGKVIPHLSCCETRVPVTAPLKVARETYRRKFDAYGKRVTRRENVDAKDWKAMYHAVRVGYEAIEFLEAGKITFPRPEAQFLLEVRQGRIPYDKVSDLIEGNLGRIERSLEASRLPEKPDREYADRLVQSFHHSAVVLSPRSSVG